MFSKKHRLPIQAFSNKNKTVFGGDYIVVKIAPNNLTYNRAGVLVGKKTIKNATKRNEAKRIVFNFIKKESSLKKTRGAKGTDTLFIVASGGDQVSNYRDELEKELRVATKKSSYKNKR